MDKVSSVRPNKSLGRLQRARDRFGNVRSAGAIQQPVIRFGIELDDTLELSAEELAAWIRMSNRRD